MSVFALTSTARVEITIVGAFVIWVALAAITANYGTGKGYPFMPLFISGVFLGFPLVLLAITIGAGPRQARNAARPPR